MPKTGERAALAIYTGTIFLSALLLFSVQPMFAKMVLPLLGGASAVWAVSMCFFQALLLLGYAWAHLLDRTVPPRLALTLQLAVFALALSALPIGLRAGSAEAASDGAYLQLIVILAAGVGLPFFALAANAPLLQAWFSRIGHAQSANAYFLYRASNAGSLAALAAYPFLVEPLLPLRLQSRVWAVGFVLLGAAVAACGWLALLSARAAPAEVRNDPVAAPRNLGEVARLRLAWAFLAFVPSGLLVAFTTYVTTDLASAPLLWVIPLALYLATFIAAFRDRPPISPRVLSIAQPVTVALTLVLMEWDASFAWVLSCAAGTLAFAVTSLACHLKLYEQRPATEHLTDFYLWLSIGGALGGIFSALIAPHLFSNVLEYPLLLALGLSGRLGWRQPGARRGDWRLLLAALAAAAVLALAVAYLAPWSWTPTRRLYALAAFAAMLVAAWRWIVLEQAATLALVLAVALVPNGNRPIHVARSFYGTHRVVEPPGGIVRLLLHGVTLHGAEWTADARPGAQVRPRPLTYYHPTGPLARG
ncbi:MAG: class I SAM-dependent methyltransferase, partial [Hyphomicrobiaceae bacterium]